MEFTKSNHVRRKYFILVLILVGAVTLFIVIHFTNNQQSKTPIASKAAASSEDKKSNSFSVGSDSKNQPIKPLSGTTLLPKGAYNDGTYTGFSSTTTGVLVIKITILTGKLTNIAFLTVPKGDYSSALNNLSEEAIQEQIVEVSPVNGYDDISVAFNKALSDAIKKSFKI